MSARTQISRGSNAGSPTPARTAAEDRPQTRASAATIQGGAA